MLRLQTIVSREVAGGQTAVVSVVSLHAGTKVNIIPDTAELEISVRTYDEVVRAHVLAAIDRIVRAEAAASNAPREPEVVRLDSFPAVVNDPQACTRTATALASVPAMLIDPGPVTGSEDVGVFAIEAEAPCTYWILGGAAPELFAGASTPEELLAVMAGLPSNHLARVRPDYRAHHRHRGSRPSRSCQEWLARA